MVEPKRNSDTPPPPPKNAGKISDEIKEEQIKVGKTRKHLFIVSKIETIDNAGDNNSHPSLSVKQPLEKSYNCSVHNTVALLPNETTTSTTNCLEEKVPEEQLPENSEDPPIGSTTTDTRKSSKSTDDSQTNTTNISDPSNISRPKPLDKTSSRVLSAPVSVPVLGSTIFDTGSVSSLPSALDSSVGRCGAAPNDRTRVRGDQKIDNHSSLSEIEAMASLQQKKLEAPHVHKLKSSVTSSVLGQHTNQNGALGTVIQHPPPPHLNKQETRFNNKQAPQAQLVVTVPQQPQQTVYYQIPEIPSVVTLPVDDITENNYCPTQQQPQHHQIQYSNQNEIQTGDQTIGMVGVMPIIKLQGGGMHYVKKKKGRFSLLQDTPVIPNVGVTPATTPGIVLENQIQIQAPIGVPQNNLTASIPIVSSSRSQSPMPRNNNAVITVPQTFDGKSAPTVKKKGRFFVTNVKDPGSIIPSLQIQAKSNQQITTELAGEANDNSIMRLQQQQFQHQHQHQHQHQQRQQVSPLQSQPAFIIQQNFQQSNVSQLPITNMQKAYEIQHPNQQNYTQFSMPVALDNQQQFPQVLMQNNQQALPSNNVQFSQIPVESCPYNQQQYVQYIPQVQDTTDPSNHSTYTVSGPISVAPLCQVYQDSQQHHLPIQQIPLSTVPTNRPPTSQSYNVSQGSIPPNVPSPMHSRSSSLNSSLPNAPMPKPPASTNTEKQQPQLKSFTKKRPTVQGRSGKVPQTIGSNGTWSSVGLGKVFYLLDQMKMEVTEADQCIKTLQTDMKLLRDKNKDLEAKNRELDKKLRDEQALREKVEIRNLDLRKKLRDAKSETTKPGKQIGKISKEERECDSYPEKLRSGHVSCIEAKPSVPCKTTEKMKSTTKKSSLHNGHSPLRNTITIATTQVPQRPKVLTTNSTHATQKEKTESKNVLDATTRPNLNRIHGGGKEIEGTNRASTMEDSITSSTIKEKPATSQTTQATAQPLIPPLRPPKNVSKTSCHKQTQSLHDFDPLKSTMPVISFPISLSLETLPAKSSPPSDSMNLTSDIGNTFVSQDPVVVLGMAPSTIRATDGTVEQHPSPVTGRHTVVANGFHELQQQQFMVVPQPEPIIFNRLTGGVQQQMVSNIDDQWTNTYLHQHQGNILQQSHHYSGSLLQQQHIQQQSHQQQIQQNQLQQQQLQQQSHQYATQHQTHHMHQNTGNPFDPFSYTSK